jgi:hypothetical protein
MTSTHNDASNSTPTTGTPATDNSIGIAGTNDTKIVTPETEPVVTGMIADPQKEGIPLFLQIQNRDQWGQGAGPLLIYEVAKRALAAATTVEEVKDIRDKALGLAAYAREANDRRLEAEAVEIRARAARRLGEMIEAQKTIIGLNTGTAGKGRPNLGGSTDNPPKMDDRPTLASQGVDKTLAHEARTLARMPEGDFEKHVAAKVEATKSRAKRPRRSREQVLLEQYPEAVHNMCFRAERVCCNLEVPLGLAAETAAALLPEVKDAIKNIRKLEAALTKAVHGGIEVSQAAGRLQ